MIYSACAVTVFLGITYWQTAVNPLRLLGKCSILALAVCYLAGEMARAAYQRRWLWRECLERARREI